MKKIVTLFLSLLVICGCNSLNNKPNPESSPVNTQNNNDPENLYLEDIYGEKAMAWVKEKNAKSIGKFEQHRKFANIREQSLKIMNDPKKLIQVSFNDEWAYNFWKDTKAVRGLWRRMPITSYLKGERQWQVLLDIDDLARQENKNWVYGGSSIFKNRALLFLSDGGKDSKVIREFDLNTRQFVPTGFNLPESKSSISWINENEVFLGLANSPEEVTPSGYAKKVRIWKRGEDPLKSKLIFTGQDNDIWTSGFATRDEENGPEHFRLISRATDFFNSEYYILDSEQKIKALSLPTDSEKDFDQNQIYLTLKSDWLFKGVSYKTGSLLRMNLDKLLRDEFEIEVIFTPTSNQFLMQTMIDHGRVFLTLSENVVNVAVEALPGHPTWKLKRMPLPEFSELSFTAYSKKIGLLMISSQGFLKPQTLHLKTLHSEQSQETLSEIDHAPAYFDSSHYEVHQYFAKSKDGTMIPYFQVNKKGLKLDGANPTIVNAYGGFEVSRLPAYMPVGELAWLRDGGVWILANIRGGGEFGPSWHTQALKQNRQKVFDDLFSVTEDLIRRKVTSPAQLGAVGGSNGGLLMGVALTQRPDLYKAICIQVPLLDMLRFHKLLAGASWVGEYGDPEVEAERAYILRYSPYQNLKSDRKYPTPFFMTSTADDRVHPGHARRMAAKLEQMGLPFYYYENTEGGHGGSANNEQAAMWTALQYTYFAQELMRP